MTPRAYLIDLDGTIYRGPQSIMSGIRFVHRLQAKKLPYLFLTNNTTRTPKMVVAKLKKHDIQTDVAHVYTPSMASVSYIKAMYPQKMTHRVYLIGQTGLKSQFLADHQFVFDDQQPDFVVVGMDTDLTYHKIRVATKAIRDGAIFIGTNADNNLPDGDELLPGNGAQCAMIAVATGKQPIYIGKPSAIIINMALEKFHLKREEALIVGDNYQTDIQAGFNSQVATLLTLTGVTQVDDLIGRQTPTYLVHNLDEWSL